MKFEFFVLYKNLVNRSFGGHSSPSVLPSSPRSNLAYITPSRGNMRFMTSIDLRFLMFVYQTRFSLRHVFFFSSSNLFFCDNLFYFIISRVENTLKTNFFYNMSTERCVIITFCVLFRWECVIKKSPAGKIGLAAKTAWRQRGTKSKIRKREL